MVHGIGTDGKYKRRKMDDEQWLSEDMLVWRRYVERDIQELGRKNEKEMKSSVRTKEKRPLSVTRVLEILILGVLGPVIFIGGLLLPLVKENYVVGIPCTMIGAIFVIALLLNEICR